MFAQVTQVQYNDKEQVAQPRHLVPFLLVCSSHLVTSESTGSGRRVVLLAGFVIENTNDDQRIRESKACTAFRLYQGRLLTVAEGTIAKLSISHHGISMKR